MTHSRFFSGGRLMRGAAAAVFALLAACGAQDGPTNPSDSELALVEASATVGGVSIDGTTVRTSENHDGRVRFEVRLMDRHDNPAPGHRVWVEYEMPGMGMMHQRGSFMLHDDGTHGDHTPGDGLYCYEDSEAQYGCHGPNARPGEYHYEFCALGYNGHETNRLKVHVTLAR